MRSAAGAAFAVGLLTCAWSFASDARDDFAPPDAAAINAAIDRGVAALRALQREDGSWGPCVAERVYGSSVPAEQACYATGPTAFALFTLAKCGVDGRAPEVRKGLRWLREHHGGRWSGYESAAVVLMLVAFHEEDVAKAQASRRRGRSVRGSRSRPPAGVRIPRDDWRWLGDRVSHLASCRVDSGGFGYWGADGDADIEPETTHYVYADVSCTHFALLALREASRAGFPVEECCGDIWSPAAAWLLDTQMTDGAFGYRPGETWSSGMTAAGAASLVLCREQILLLGNPVPPDVDGAIERALARMGEQFDPGRNRQGQGVASLPAGRYHYYYLYGIERVGDLTGRRELGGQDWYLRGAAWLLRMQLAGGAWIDTTCMSPQDCLGTCFALLFLKRATMPVITTAGD